MIKIYLKSLKVLRIKFEILFGFRKLIDILFRQLQYQISSKLLEVLKVIDMLTSIIEKNDEEDVKKTKSPDTDSSPERIKNELLESMNKKKQEQESK